MIGTLFGTVFLITSFFQSTTQSGRFVLDFTDPESVVRAIFYAARERDFDILSQLCDPRGEGDGDTKNICEIPSLIEKSKQSDGMAGFKEELDEFIGIFKTGKITGEVNFRSYQGANYANVPFWFAHPGGAERSNETMTLVEREKKWYLYSF